MTTSSDALLLEDVDALPARVSAPFKALLKVGGIDPAVLRAVLDAGAITRRSDTLLGFAIALQTMERQQVPVIDTIRMAKEYGRRINLQWSAKRWGDEHQRLSRLATLRQLSSEHCSYDVSDVERHLPATFKGYLIRTSRRLGMEGLRQRHCVAAYHGQIIEKRFAIAVVFVDKRRWTVQLASYSGSGSPVRILQAKSRLNALPTRKQLDQIHAQLGIQRATPTSNANTLQRKRYYKENLQQVLPTLRELGVKSVTIDFDGSGDSGSIDSVSVDPSNISLNTIVVVSQYRAEFKDDAWHTIAEPQHLRLEDAMTEIANDYLEETDVNWYDNEGGYGSMEIDVQEGTVALEVNVRELTSSTEFEEKLDIESGEAL